jgi:hypothetical protein
MRTTGPVGPSWRALALLSLVPTGTACGSDRERVDVASSVRIPVLSVHRGREYELRVALPRSYDDASRQFPVLYVLDGSALFGVATDVTRLLSLRGAFPELIVVGVAYPTLDRTDVLRQRLADLTPTNVLQEDTLHGTQALAARDRSGNGEAFTRALLEEILPTVERRFRVDSTHRILWGYSLGGLFALNVMLDHPGRFRSFLVTSPSLWWDSDRIFGHPALRVPEREPGRVGVFLSAGGLEESADPWARMATNLSRFHQALLDRGDGVAAVSEVFARENHLSVPAISFARGIQVLLSERAR